MIDEIFRLKNLKFTYPQTEKNSNETPVLTISDMNIQKGKIITFRGHNGSGKTTLLKILGGLLKPDSGEILYCGTPLESSDQNKKTIMVQQEPYLFHGSVLQNLALPMWFQKSKMKSGLINETLKLVGLEGFEKRKARELSGGEKKRVAIARALMTTPQVLLLDEPDANVDVKTSRELENLIVHLRNRGMSIILCSHNEGFAYRTSDEIIDLYHGKPVDHNENIFKGSYIYREGLYSHFRTDNLLFTCPSRHGDYTTIVISANDVFVTKDKINTSDFNQLSGKLKSIESFKEDRYTLTIDCGVLIKSRITSSALHLLNAMEGDILSVVFNPSAVHLY